MLLKWSSPFTQTLDCCEIDGVEKNIQIPINYGPHNSLSNNNPLWFEFTWVGKEVLLRIYNHDI